MLNPRPVHIGLGLRWLLPRGACQKRKALAAREFPVRGAGRASSAALPMPGADAAAENLRDMRSPIAARGAHTGACIHMIVIKVIEVLVALVAWAVTTPTPARRGTRNEIRKISPNSSKRDI